MVKCYNRNIESWVQAFAISAAVHVSEDHTLFLFAYDIHNERLNCIGSQFIQEIHEVLFSL